jgi:hypothetical protein
MAPLTLRRKIEQQYVEPRRKDPYRSDKKYAGNPRCPSCYAIFVRGKWLPEARAAALLDFKRAQLGRLETITCPACLQLRDHYAMSVVELHGERWKQNSKNVFSTVEKSESIARLRNDQQRILWSLSHDGITRIYVTLPELARHIGRTLARSFKGKTKIHRSSEEPWVRVIWNSDAPLYRKSLLKRGTKSRHARGRGSRPRD